MVGGVMLRTVGGTEIPMFPFRRVRDRPLPGQCRGDGLEEGRRYICKRDRLSASAKLKVARVWGGGGIGGNGGGRTGKW